MHFVDYSIAMQEGYLESPVNRNNSNHDVAVGPMTGLDLTSIKCIGRLLKLSFLIL